MSAEQLRRERVELGSVDSEDWDRLALASRNLFATREFLATWWDHFGGGRELFLTACRDGSGELVGLLPLYRDRRAALRVARFVGHGPGDQLGPVCGEAARPAVADALTRTLRELRCNVVLAEHLPAAEGWRRAIDGRVLREESSPLVAAESWDAYLASRSGHFRRKLRWQERRLAADGSVVYRLTDGGSLERDLDSLFRLHNSRWDARTEFAAQSAFHREFARDALERGRLRLWQLELDGTVVASLYGFRFAQREWHVQSGRDPSITAVSPGLLLLAHSIRAAFEEGVREYLLLRGGEEYKYRFATDDTLLESVVLGAGPVGRSAVRAASLLDRLGPLGAGMRRRLRA